MKFDFRKLGRVGKNAENIFKVAAPYYLINKKSAGIKRKMVVFFGSDFKNLPRDVNIEEFVKINNRCLDFIRHEYAGYELYYKPHPMETDEFQFLDLGSFEVEKDKTIAEFFLYKNLNQIKYVFSVCSTASISAYGLGLNSYIFVRLFEPAFGDISSTGFKDYFEGMPEPFFISDLNRKLEENKITLGKNDFLEKQWAELLDRNRGTIWFIGDDPGFLSIMISFAKLIKGVSPSRKIGMIMTRIKRWDLVNKDEIMEDFDKLIFLPVVYCSFKPAKLLDVIKTALAVKKFKINTGDILFGISPNGFAINCFVSYFKKNLSIGLIRQRDFELSYDFKAPLDSSDYVIKSSKIFFNKIIEPLLGLYQTVSRLERPGGRGGFAISRYQRPINEVFDMVYVLKIADQIGP